MFIALSNVLLRSELKRGKLINKIKANVLVKNKTTLIKWFVLH